MTPIEPATCGRCGDTGLVDVRRCAPGCGGIRHTADCPIVAKTKCPACERAEMGDDLT